jgi:hypothetical protein
MRDESLEIVGRQVLAREQHQRHVGDKRDRREVGRRIVERPLVERLVERMRADRAEHEGQAVGIALRDAQRPGHAAGAGHVVDDDLAADRFAEIVPEDAAEHVDRAAGRERHHHGERPARPALLRMRESCEAQNDCGNDCKNRTHAEPSTSI